MDNKTIEWGKYLQYLRDWAEFHSEIEFYGMAPACFDEWYENEYGQEDEE